MSSLLDITEKTVEITFGSMVLTASQLFIDDWIELEKKGYVIEDIAKTNEELSTEGKNAYEFRKLIVWRGLCSNYPELKDGFPERSKVSVLEISIAARKILELENLAVANQVEVMTES